MGPLAQSGIGGAQEVEPGLPSLGAFWRSTESTVYPTRFLILISEAKVEIELEKGRKARRRDKMLRFRSASLGTSLWGSGK